jgi:outer membrane protein
MRITRTLAVLILAGTATTAMAEDAPATTIDTSGNRVTVGVGAAILPSYIGSNNTVVVPALAVQGQTGGISYSLQGTSVTLDAIRGRGKPGWKLQAGPVVSLRLDRNGLIRDPAVKALGKIDAAWEAGGWVGIQRTGVITSDYDTLSLSATWQHDLNHVHNSYVVSPSIDYATPLSTEAYADLSFNADYVGRGFGATYYDISSAGSATSGLPAYVGADRAGWKDWSTNLLLARSLTGNLTHGIAVFGTVNYARLLGAYARSPIVADVGSANQWSGGVGVAVTF